MTPEEGLKEIMFGEWERDSTSTLNLFVTDEDGNRVHAWLSLRPHYCDRGHIQLNIEGIPDLDGADNFPRFFFFFEEADEHTRNFLKWRLWKHRVYPHTLSPIGLKLTRC